MILRFVAFVDLALRWDRALRTFEEVRPVCGAEPRCLNMHVMLHYEEDECKAPVGSWRNSGSKLRMQQVLRKQHNPEGQP